MRWQNRSIPANRNWNCLPMNGLMNRNKNHQQIGWLESNITRWGVAGHTIYYLAHMSNAPRQMEHSGMYCPEIVRQINTREIVCQKRQRCAADDPISRNGESKKRNIVWARSGHSTCGACPLQCPIPMVVATWYVPVELTLVEDCSAFI